MSKITIVGAGLVGTLEAIFLAKRGFEVDIYEKRSDPRTKGYVGGRSINLALSDRGWKALERAGIKESIQQIAIPMYGRTIHSEKGDITYQPYGKNDQAIYSVSRGELNIQLIKEASKYKNIQFFFDHHLENIEFEKNELYFTDKKTHHLTSVVAERVISAEGAYSEIRNKMEKRMLFNYSQEYISHGYKEVKMPANGDGAHKMEKNTLHIWPRKDFMLIALPNLDGTFTCTLFLSHEGENAFSKLDTWPKYKTFFKQEFPDAFALIPELEKEYEENPVSSLIIIKCAPWNIDDKVLLIGDAAHAIVPFFGQGMNCGFEDCIVLDNLLDKEKDPLAIEWKKIFHQFSKERKPDADAICELALQNFIEMRDLVGEPKFILRKKIEAKLSEKFPKKWSPLYSMVTFSSTHYSEALKIGLKQDQIMKEVMKTENLENKWLEDNFYDEIDRKYLN